MKSYANGIDWVVAGLNAACRQMPGGGNHFLVAAEFAIVITPEEIRQLLDELPESLLKWLNGRWKRAWHLAPYWRPGTPQAIPCEFVEDENWHAQIVRFANVALPKNCCLTVKLIDSKTSWRLIFKFSHLLFDGAGAELFLRMLLQGQAKLPDGCPGSPTPALNRWGELFTAGRRLNASLRKFSRVPLRQLYRGNKQAGCDFLTASFMLDEVSAACDSRFGPFTLGSVLAAVVGRALWLWDNPAWPPGNILLPMSVNLRRAAQKEANIFFNRWSLMPLYWAGMTADDGLDWWVAQVRQQLAELTATGLAYDFERANLLMRIIPASLEGRLALSRFRNGAGSAMFSFISESTVPLSWNHRPIASLIHYPIVPPQPGLGIFFTAYGQQLNLTMTWQQQSFPDGTVERLFSAIVEELKIKN